MIFVAKMGKYGTFVGKWVNTAFLSQNFVNTRSSIAFKDMLRSSIAPQIVLHWIGQDGPLDANKYVKMAHP